MGYNKEIYRLAYEQLEQRRARNRHKSERRKQEIEQVIPEYRQLGIEIFSLIGEGIKTASQAEGTSAMEQLKQTACRLEEQRRNLLIQKGYPADYLEDIYDCPACRDTGFVMDKMCGCLEKLLRETAYHQNNIQYILDVRNLSDFHLDYYDDTPRAKQPSCRSSMENILKDAQKFIASFADPAQKNLLFFGGTGLGKTFLSSCIAKELLSKEYTVFYQTASKIIDIVENYKFYRKDVNYDIENAMENIYSSDLLIIDDLGTEARTAYSTSAIFDIVNSRLLNQKKMIINTNLDLQDIEQLYTTRLTSRLIGSFRLCAFSGTDIRLQKALQEEE